MADMRIRAGLCSLVTLLALLAPQPLPVTAATPSVADPAVGPHALDDARHSHDVVPMAPVTSTPQSRRMLPNTGAAPVYGGSGLTHEVFGFAPYWALPSGASWDYSLLTTVSYFGLDANANGTINDTTLGWQHWSGDGNLTTVISKAHAAQDRVVVTVKAFNQSTICSIVMFDATTQTMIDNIINVALTDPNHPVDGVNVDFEGSSSPGCAPTNYPDVQSGFTHFMTQLTAQVHSRIPTDQVSVDTYSGSASWDGGIFNIGQLGAVVDALFTMNYDMYLGGQASPNAPMNGGTYNDALTVSQYVSKAPASKVILGVAYYGYKWSTVDNTPRSTAVSGPSSIPYVDVLSDLACAQQLAQAWDYPGQVPWASWWSPPSGDPCGGNYGHWREVYWDSAASLGIKYDLVNSYNIRGAGMWALGYDGGAPELWAVLRAKFTTSWPGQYHPLTPARILDTRNSSSPVGAGRSIEVQVSGQGGVPAGATAVVLNATGTQPSQPTYLTLYPAGVGKPDSSNVNLRPGQTAANLAEVALGPGGKIDVFNAAGSVHVILDVAGYVTSSAGSTDTGGRFNPMQPARLLDTRALNGGTHAPLGPGQAISVQVTGRFGIPSGAQAVVVNLTVTHPTAPSFLKAYPTGVTPPNVSNLNFVAGEERANRAIVQLSADGAFMLFNAAGQTDVVVDVNGWFAPGGGAGLETAVSPVRIADTRLGFGAPHVDQGQTIVIQVAGMGPIPTMTAPVATRPAAVVANVTVTDTTASSYVTIFPGLTPQPPTSDINFTAAQSVPNLVLIKLGSDGTIEVYNRVGAANVIVDVLGWYS